jgi:thiol-disulfide isomerase/thioredoxin
MTPAVLLLAVGLIAGAGAVKKEWLEGNEDERARFKEMEGKPAPALAVENFMNGDAVTLDKLKGKVVLLDFWATWCGPCIAAIPHTNELAEKYKDKGLVIIGVCHTEGSEKMADVVTEKGIKYLVAADSDKQTIGAYKVNSYPDYYFIDRDGNVRIADCNNRAVDEVIEALLSEGATASAK